jgi:hypothetical protein
MRVNNEPLAVKITYISLGDKLKEYEDYFGNIPSPESLNQKVMLESQKMRVIWKKRAFRLVL